MHSRMIADPRLSELLALQGQLVAATREWSRGAAPDPATNDARRRALEINHLRYIERIPVYQQLALDLGFARPAPLETLVNELLLTDEVFKGYPPGCLESGDFAALTRWLESIFSHPLEVDCRGLSHLQAWRERMRQSGVQVTCSSGTSGRMSFVPRDPLTWKALLRNGECCADQTWWRDPLGQPLPHDCLLVGPRGDSMGIQSAGAGLARGAARVHYLFGETLSADGVRTAAQPGVVTPPGNERQPPPPETQPEIYLRAAEFLAESAAQQRPVLVFGTPFQVRRFCEQLIALGRAVPCHPLSVVATGGGWKSFAGERVPQAELRSLVHTALDIEAPRCRDAYSTSELNCTLVGCSAHRYHVPPLVEVVVVDAACQGQPGQPGTGTLAFLDPFAISYPGFFLTGDIATLQAGDCPCGRKGWYLEGEISRPPEREVKGCGGVLAAVFA